MDHKISKDMISSGMIPSGEKTQADLGRTQYGSAPSPSSLMDAYKSIYEHHQKDADGKVIEHGEKEELSERVKGGGVSSSLPKQKEKQKVIDKLTGYDQTQKGVGAASLIPNSAFKEETGDRRRTTTRVKPEVKPQLKPEVKPEVKPSKPPYSKQYPLNMMTGLDLFDLVKGTLLDEGCDEQEALRIMANLSEEERESLLQNINELFGIKNRIDNKLNQMRNNSKLGGNKRVDDVRTNSGDPNVGKKINFGN